MASKSLRYSLITCSHFFVLNSHCLIGFTFYRTWPYPFLILNHMVPNLILRSLEEKVMLDVGNRTRLLKSLFDECSQYTK